MTQKIADDISKEFTQISGLACKAQFLEKGENHKPTQLIRGKEKGVYVFLLDEKQCFKVGKAGADSMARWNSHHYNLDRSTPSTFTKSFLSDIPNFSKFFDGKPKAELLRFNEILKTKLGKNYRVNPASLKKISEANFAVLQKEINIKGWVTSNISRIEFKLSNDSSRNYDIDLLEKLVAFKLRPLYEG